MCLQGDSHHLGKIKKFTGERERGTHKPAGWRRQGIMSGGLPPLLSRLGLSGGRHWRSIVSLRALHTCPAALSINKLPAGRHTIPESRAQVEVSTAEWKYVERLFPPKAIPKPTAAPGQVMPSGWVAPSAKPGDHPYFVRRSPSHQLPVYLSHNPIISKYRTTINHVEGDVWTLLEELRVYLQQRREPKVLNMRAHEPHQKIEIKGQYVTEVRDFLLDKGF